MQDCVVSWCAAGSIALCLLPICSLYLPEKHTPQATEYLQYHLPDFSRVSGIAV